MRKLGIHTKAKFPGKGILKTSTDSKVIAERQGKLTKYLNCLLQDHPQARNSQILNDFLSPSLIPKKKKNSICQNKTKKKKKNKRTIYFFFFFVLPMYFVLSLFWLCFDVVMLTLIWLFLCLTLEKKKGGDYLFQKKKKKSKTRQMSLLHPQSVTTTTEEALSKECNEKYKECDSNRQKSVNNTTSNINSTTNNKQKPETVLENLNMCCKANNVHSDDELHRLLHSLPTYGIVHNDKHTNFWYILLSEEWQKESTKLVRLCEEKYWSHVWVKNGQEKGYLWHNIISSHINQNSRIRELDHCSHYKNKPTIQWVTPPAAAGNSHIHTFFFFNANDKNYYSRSL
ncbi:hypothetical protein RFI_16049 [Reticulomyxa filosa]|uniref:PX domain-containing protein n=1 Tax=Reticulomyxa filosa TaxID=46433 RepID=X6N4D8_RETFI|nr:hypothetical protein RFI_16049 [Reticulomyxa filosa]|eukprot:ETO21155.1 hypothetical protein RFI_16049 [Reticulomyxa filosa]